MRCRISASLCNGINFLCHPHGMLRLDSNRLKLRWSDPPKIARIFSKFFCASVDTDDGMEDRVREGLICFRDPVCRRRSKSHRRARN